MSLIEGLLSGLQAGSNFRAMRMNEQWLKKERARQEELWKREDEEWRRQKIARAANAAFNMALTGAKAKQLAPLLTELSSVPTVRAMALENSQAKDLGLDVRIREYRPVGDGSLVPILEYVDPKTGDIISRGPLTKNRTTDPEDPVKPLGIKDTLPIILSSWAWADPAGAAQAQQRLQEMMAKQQEQQAYGQVLDFAAQTANRPRYSPPRQELYSAEPGMRLDMGDEPSGLSDAVRDRPASWMPAPGPDDRTPKTVKITHRVPNSAYVVKRMDLLEDAANTVREAIESGDVGWSPKLQKALAILKNEGKLPKGVEPERFLREKRLSDEAIAAIKAQDEKDPYFLSTPDIHEDDLWREVTREVPASSLVKSQQVEPPDDEQLTQRLSTAAAQPPTQEEAAQIVPVGREITDTVVPPNVVSAAKLLVLRGVMDREEYARFVRTGRLDKGKLEFRTQNDDIVVLDAETGREVNRIVSPYRQAPVQGPDGELIAGPEPLSDSEVRLRVNSIIGKYSDTLPPEKLSVMAAGVWGAQQVGLDLGNPADFAAIEKAASEYTRLKNQGFLDGLFSPINPDEVSIPILAAGFKVGYRSGTEIYETLTTVNNLVQASLKKSGFKLNGRDQLLALRTIKRFELEGGLKRNDAIREFVRRYIGAKGTKPNAR